jgi:hypothetical protein
MPMKDKILLPGRPNEATQVLTLQQNGGFVFANNKIESHRRREQVGIVPQVSDLADVRRRSGDQAARRTSQ